MPKSPRISPGIENRFLDTNILRNKIATTRNYYNCMVNEAVDTTKG
jgi:hypothetical protein